MSDKRKQDSNDNRTTTDTKRVFLRANKGDEIKIVDIKQRFENKDIPESFKIVQRQETYYGPKIRVEGPSEQWFLSSPARDLEGILWHIEEMDWVRTAEVELDFTGELPQYDICSYCGEPIKTTEHETAAYLGTCTVEATSSHDIEHIVDGHQDAVTTVIRDGISSHQNSINKESLDALEELAEAIEKTGSTK